MSRKPSNRSGKAVEFNTLLKELDQERSLPNLLPDDLRYRVLTLPEEYINKQEDELLAILARTTEKGEHSFKPTAVNDALRNNFWIEHDRLMSTRSDKQMNMSNIYLGVCTRQMFYLLSDKQIAYMLCPFPEYRAVMAGMQSLANRRIRDILNIPLQKEDGSYNDTKLIELVLKAAAMVDLRNQGSYISRVETKNLTMIDQKTTSVSAIVHSTVSGGTAEITQEELDKKLIELDNELKKMPEAITAKLNIPEREREAVEVEFKEV